MSHRWTPWCWGDWAPSLPACRCHPRPQASPPPHASPAWVPGSPRLAARPASVTVPLPRGKGRVGGALTAPHEEADLARSSRGPVPSLRVLAAPLSLAESLPFSAWLTPRQGCVGVPWRPAGPRSKRQRALAGSCCRTSFLSLAVTPHGVLMHMRHRAFPQRLVVKCLRARAGRAPHA